MTSWPIPTGRWSCSFKTRIDPFVQKLSFIRIYSGTLSNETVHARHSEGAKLGQSVEIEADKTEAVDTAAPRRSSP